MRYWYRYDHVVTRDIVTDFGGVAKRILRREEKSDELPGRSWTRELGGQLVHFGPR